MSLDSHDLTLNRLFYLENNIAIRRVVPNESITSGGMLLNITGSNLNLAQELKLQVSSGIYVYSRVGIELGFWLFIICIFNKN